MIEWLVSVAFQVADVAVTWGEVLGFATGILNVGLLVWQRPLNWPVGIVNVLLLMVVFWHAGLYADASLQIVYVALGLFGWWQWLFGGAGGSRRVVTRTTGREWLWLLVIGLLATAAVWLLLDRATDSTVPLADATTTVLSLLATYGQTLKRVESWLIWILADLIYIPLYLYKGLWLTSVLYAVFLCLCIAGLRAWQRDLSRRRLA